jgi:hypothetical protein
MKRRGAGQVSQGSFPIEPRRVDEELLALFSAQRYDRINHVVSEGVCETYRHELSTACGLLLENERVIGRIAGDRGAQKGGADQADAWRCDPAAMSNADLFRARVDLQRKIEQQKALNEQGRNELDILQLAAETIELEVGCMFTQLEIEENKDF